MQEVLPKELFMWNGKRPLQTCNPLPPVKRQKRHLLPDTSGGEAEEQPSCVHPVSQQEKPCLYPCVVYKGDIATVKLGVGQMVMLEGCAMVRVVEGHVGMLGYSFPQGTEILVCSSSDPMELVTIEAGQGKYHEGGREALGCQLRFASHRLGQPCASGAGVLSFTLEFVGSLGSSLGKKMDQQSSEEQNQVHERNKNDQPNLDTINKADHELVEDSFKKRKTCGQNKESSKRLRMVEKLDNYSSSTSLSHKGVESRGLGVPVVASAMQRMLESLHLLGS